MLLKCLALSFNWPRISQTQKFDKPFKEFFPCSIIFISDFAMRLLESAKH